MAGRPAIDGGGQSGQAREHAEAVAHARWRVMLADEAATERLAAILAREIAPGDLITLSGDLGAGKTFFARAFIRRLADDSALEVPSPTFTLVQTYETRRGLIVHGDLYRIADADELESLGFEEAAENAIVLLEWPERAGSALPSDRLDIAFHLVPDEGAGVRRATLTGIGRFAQRLSLIKAVRELIERTGWGDAERTHMNGDASVRSYERLTKASGETAVLMIAPPRLPAAPVRHGKPYHVIARLAERVDAFVAVDKALRALGLSAPEIYGQDLDAGVLLLEDLGSEPVVRDGAPIPERYAEAVRLIAWLHDSDLPTVLPVAEGRDHVLPPYDIEALLIEVELLIDWYAPHRGGGPVSATARNDFVQVWTRLLAEITGGPVTWTLRDFHSPNLIWLEEREGIARLGLLDFQDAVLGHPAYDLAALLQDARATVPAELELKLLALYAQERLQRNAAFDAAGFSRAYAVLGAQRATKLFGTFTRLDKRDGKPEYLAHLPRFEVYLQRNLAHPVLSELKLWYETHLPHLVRGG